MLLELAGAELGAEVRVVHAGSNRWRQVVN